MKYLMITDNYEAIELEGEQLGDSAVIRMWNSRLCNIYKFSVAQNRFLELTGIDPEVWKPLGAE